MTDTPDIVERLQSALRKHGNIGELDGLEAIGAMISLRGEVERLTEERDAVCRIHERALDEQRAELQKEIEGWQTERNVARGDQEAAEDRADALQAQLEKVREAEPDWWYCDVDPDDSGDSPHEALRNEANFSIVLLHSNYVGPDKYAFRADTLATDDDDNEVLLFDTEEEAIAAAEERRTALASITEGETG